MAVKHVAAGLLFSPALLLVVGGAADGEVFLLTNGGRLTGQLLNPKQSPRHTYVIQTPIGATVTLKRSQVKKVLDHRPDQLQYEKIRPQYPDTVEGQWALAQWCHKRGLTAQRTTHLQRVIELDPDHVDARRRLGYQRLGGRWVTQEQLMLEQGYRKYRGRWLTPQQIELAENKRKVETAQKEWAQKLKRWRGWLDTDRDGQGQGNIKGIDDPHAVDALARALGGNDSERAKILYIETLARIGTPEAIRALATCSIEDSNEEIRLTCLDHLQTEKRPAVVEYYVSKLRHKDNRVVNWAAVCLGRMKDPSAIGPLIDALVTTHQYKIMPRNPGGMSATFPTGGTPGGTGLSMNPRPRIIRQNRTNQSVLDALVALSGQNFNFDQQAWKYWYASQKDRARLDARRS